jgi:uncharacterized protein (TIGR03083 family)
MNEIARPATRSDRPRTSTLDRPTLMRLAETEYGRVTSMLLDLSDHDWSRPTECPGWDVRAMAGHVLGMAEMAASPRETCRQLWAVRRRGGGEVFIDALTGLQVDKNAGLTSRQLCDRVREVGPRATRGRRRTPGPIRRLRLPVDQAVGGQLEAWTFGYLIDTVLTRDPWMHRVDISRTTGRPLDLTAEHDGVLVGDVVADWARRHGQPCELHLTGTAGGRWSFGADGPHLEMDAIEFCRTLSGREEGEGLLAVQVPF